MNAADIDFEMLSAYVDGELEPAEAARVAAAAASDPRLAGAIARLQSLRASISDDVPAFVHVPAVAAHANRGRWIGWAAAAVIVCGLALSAGFLALRGDAQSTALARDLAPLVELHDRWLETSVPSSALRVASATPVDTLLAATGLRLVLTDRLVVDGASDATHSRFVGERGCRLSLFVAPAAGPAPDRLEITEQAGLHVAHWVREARSYTVVARDMDANRFHMIASSLRQILPEDGDHQATRLAHALGEARQPCLVG
jgi:anti-sigma factor RsiW